MKKQATLVRMVTPDHLCPWGIKAADLLRRNGYAIEDRLLRTKEANEAYKREHGYDETPQIFADGRHIGGYDALRVYLGLSPDPREGDTYQPVVVVFAMALAMAIAVSLADLRDGVWLRTAELFVAFSMCILGVLKLQDLRSFATGFVQYDLVARRYVPYAYVYAFVEAVGGVLMIADLLPFVVAPAVLVVSAIGTVSVVHAVYVQKRDLHCACVGGDSSVPLGFISLSENVIMLAMAVWMLVRHGGLASVGTEVARAWAA